MTATTPHEPLQILLVEDNLADARIIEISLRELSLRTQLMVVENGEAALAFLRKHAPYTDMPQPDLILLDLHLPRKNGFEVLDEIYDDPQLCTIPVVVCLGSTLEAERLDRYALPVDCVFTKGYDPERLLHVLTRCPNVTAKAA